MVGHRLDSFDPLKVLGFRSESALPGRLFRILRDRTAGRGELRLALAVLEDAFRCLGCLDGSRGSFHGKDRREAREWIESRDREGLFTFENVCSALGLDAKEIRRLVSREANRRATDARFPPPIPWEPRAETKGRRVVSLIRRRPILRLVQDSDPEIV